MRFGLANGFTDHLYTPLGTTSNYSAIADFHTLQITSTHQVFSVSTSRILATDFNTVINNSLTITTPHKVLLSQLHSCN
jgi:hypothetical protein